MDETGAPPDLDARLFGLRVVVTGLLAGLVVLAGVVVFSTLKLTGPIVPGPEVAYLFLAIAGLGLVANFVAVPVVVVRQRAAAGDDPFRAYAAETFLRAAALEAPAVFSVLGFLITADWLVLAPAAVFAALLVGLLPSRAKYDAWRESVRAATAGGPYG